MACDRDMLLLVSAYADGETTSEQSAIVEAHLETCADCKASLQDWQGQKELLNWAYTVPLPELSRDFERSNAQVVPKRPSIVKRMQTMSTQFIGHGKLAIAAVVIALVIVAGVKIQQMRKPSYMPVGKSLVSLNHEKHISTEENVRLTLGPDSIITRINDRTIRLQKGWVEAEVREHTGLKVLTDRMEVTDQGTKFRVGTRPVLDYVLVDKGYVSVVTNKTTHQLKPGQVIIVPQKGKVWVADLPEESQEDITNARPVGQEMPFLPCDLFETERREGMKRLAARFPEVRIISGEATGSSGGSEDTSDSIGNYYIIPTVGCSQGMRDHFADLAQVIAGGTIDSPEWEIPVAILQVSGTKSIHSLLSDVYFVRLASKNGTIVWRFTGSLGTEADLPLATEKLTPIASSRLSGESNHVRTDYDEKLFETRGLSYWPGELKPIFTLEILGRPKTEIWRDRYTAFTKVTKIVPQTLGSLYKIADTHLSYLDASRTNIMFVAWNANAGAQLSKLQKGAKRGYGGSVIIGALLSSVPLLEPVCEKGIYLIRFVIPAHSESPHLEISTVDNRVVSAWNASSKTIADPKKGEIDINGGSTDNYRATMPPGIGSVFFQFTTTPVKNGGFNILFQVVGMPDDKSTLPMKIKGGWQQREPSKTWAEGWIRLKQP